MSAKPECLQNQHSPAKKTKSTDVPNEESGEHTDRFISHESTTIQEMCWCTQPARLQPWLSLAETWLNDSTNSKKGHGTRDIKSFINPILSYFKLSGACGWRCEILDLFLGAGSRRANKNPAKGPDHGVQPLWHRLRDLWLSLPQKAPLCPHADRSPGPSGKG